MNIEKTILEASKTALIDNKFESDIKSRPQFISNHQGNKVLNSIKKELLECDEFIISTAFITLSGLTPLLNDFLELENNNIKGKILTTDYLTFTEPQALKKLNNMSNIEVRMYPEEKNNFHTKGYIFRKGNCYKCIIGSSNLTLNALTLNKEWNVKFTSLKEGELINDILSELNDLWDNAYKLNDILPEYEKNYLEQKKFTKHDLTYNKIKSEDKLLPNQMQVEFLKNIRNLIQKNENKALLISATGTGKTYASAFAVQDFNPKKFLFLVHREQIARQAIQSYIKVFGNDEKFGLLSGTSKELDKDYLFSTIQTMSKENIYKQFDKDEFDYIVIDEVHKAGAESYIRVMNYFKPKFWLGMTASPERTDSFDIYELFDHNIAHEIRLKEAMEEDLLCPFHYFGITDIEINGKVPEDKNIDFNYLTSDKRVEYLLEKSEYFGYSGSRLKSIIFCSTKKEANILAKKFREKNHPAIALTGEDSQEKRENAIRRLVDDDCEDYLEYIITVDIFNEGVDIPEINQVLLVRPTQSPIIFIQQLGRGLRKYNNKEYVVIIDFIGNYNNNFMIPIALSGDMSHDKDALRLYIMEGNSLIPGASSINFDKISKERIYNSINDTSFSRIALFKQSYRKLKYKLGKIPMLSDFYNNQELDPKLILDHNKFNTYYNFLTVVEKDFEDELSNNEVKYLKFISKELSDGKRPHELLILKLLSINQVITYQEIETELTSRYNIHNDKKSIEHSVNFLNLNFFTDKVKEKYDNVKYLHLEENRLIISDDFKACLESETFKKYFEDVIEYALRKYEDNYNLMTEGVNLKLYQKYSRKDVCRLLNWPHDDSSTMYGYRIKHNTCPIFVTYDKKENISSSTKYQDEFVNNKVFSWMTRSRVSENSKEAQSIINYKDENIKLHMFIKKSDDEGKEFYYLGQVEPIQWKETTILNDKKDELPIMNFKLKFHNTIKDDLYRYFKD